MGRKQKSRDQRIITLALITAMANLIAAMIKLLVEIIDWTNR